MDDDFDYISDQRTIARLGCRYIIESTMVFLLIGCGIWQRRTCRHTNISRIPYKLFAQLREERKWHGTTTTTGRHSESHRGWVWFKRIDIQQLTSDQATTTNWYHRLRCIHVCISDATTMRPIYEPLPIGTQPTHVPIHDKRHPRRYNTTTDHARSHNDSTNGHKEKEH